MCVHACGCVYMCVHMDVYVCMHVDVCACMWMYVYVYVCMHVCAGYRIGIHSILCYSQQKHCSEWGFGEFHSHSTVISLIPIHNFQSVLYSHFELVLMDADWLIACLKTELDTTSSEDILGGGVRGVSLFQVPFHC